MPAPRPRVRPTQGLHNLGRGVKTGNGYVTTCKVCRHTCKVCRRGVFEAEPHRWFLAAPLGISHDACRPGEVAA